MDLQLFGADAAMELLASYGPKPMQARIDRASVKAGKAMVPLIRREIKRSIKGHGHNPGMLVRKVRSRKSLRSKVLQSAGGTGTTLVGSTAPHNHLVIRGHRIVSHSGAATGGRTRSNPFIERTSDAAWAIARPIFQREVFG